MRTSEIALLLTLGGCPNPEPVPFDCEVGLLVGGVFTPIGDEPARAELVFGFQGFLWVELAARGADAPDVASVTLLAEPEGRDPAGTTLAFIRFDDRVPRQSDPLQLRLDNDGGAAGYADRLTTLSARIESDRQVCAWQGVVLLVDDDPCIAAEDPGTCVGDDDDSAGSR